MAQPTVARLARRSLLMKVETDYGVDPTALTGTDEIEAYNIVPAVGPQMTEIPGLGGAMGSLGLIPGVRLAQVSFEQIWRGAGSAYDDSPVVAPNFHLPLRGCGFQATFAADPKWTYVPRSTGFESMALYVLQENGPSIKILGAFGDAQLVCQVGRPVVARYTFTGIYQTEADDTPAFAQKVFTVGSNQYPVILSSAFQVSTENYAAPWSQLSLNLGNMLDLLEGPNAASGVAGAYIANRRPTGTIDPETVKVATFPWITKLEAGTVMDASWQTNGAQYKRVKFTLAGAVLRARGWQQRGQKSVFGINFDLVPSASGDDEITIVTD